MSERKFDQIIQFEIGNYKNFVYLILDSSTHQAGIVDPQEDLSLPLNYLKEHQFDLNAIILTHTHFDHIAGVPKLLQAYPTLPIYVHTNDLHRLSQKTQKSGNIKSIQDEDQIQIGNTQIRVLHTPGHSAGECCYFLEGTPPSLLTGDTVFIRDCGRTDLETGSNQQMFESLQRIKKLPPETVILPGHHYVKEHSSTLANELRDSLPFQCKNVEELRALP